MQRKMDMRILLESFEKYVEETNKKEEYVEEEEIMGMYIVSQVLSWVTFILAFYLSWQCNSKNRPGMDDVEKVVRAIFAGIFGFLYIVIYLLVWSDDCNNKK